jgi:hypothetical protein
MEEFTRLQRYKAKPTTFTLASEPVRARNFGMAVVGRDRQARQDRMV